MLPKGNRPYKPLSFFAEGDLQSIVQERLGFVGTKLSV